MQQTEIMFFYNLAEFLAVNELNWTVHDGKLCVNWLKTSNVVEYLIETVSIPDKEMWWQRVSRKSSTACLEGELLTRVFI